MGKKNPIKQLVKTTTDVFTNPVRETARAIGADGVVDVINQGKSFVTGSTNSAIDLASGKTSQMKKEAAAEGARQAAAQQAAFSESQRQAQLAESNRIESERMSAGQKSRTLLTGSSGLDEEESISRRVLRGF